MHLPQVFLHPAAPTRLTHRPLWASKMTGVFLRVCSLSPPSAPRMGAGATASLFPPVPFDPSFPAREGKSLFKTMPENQPSCPPSPPVPESLKVLPHPPSFSANLFSIAAFLKDIFKLGEKNQNKPHLPPHPPAWDEVCLVSEWIFFFFFQHLSSSQKGLSFSKHDIFLTGCSLTLCL